MASSNDPRLLYSINNVLAFHLQDGEESSLTPSGPQTLSLLMVPTTASTVSQNENLLPYAPAQESPSEEDFYLHLHLPPELDLALPATTQIYHQPPNSYLIPRWDLGPDAGAFIRIQFPGIGSAPNKVTQEDIDTFETILAQCTAFLERAEVSKDNTSYNPANFAPGEGYVSPPDAYGSHDRKDQHGRIVLVDEENGSVVGEMEGYDVTEKDDVKPGSKRPVEIQLPAEGEGNLVSVSNVSEEYLSTSRHPAYKDSSLVQSSATASRLIVTGSTYFANAMVSGADAFTKKIKPNPKPATFSDTTHTRIRKIGTFSDGAADISSKTVGQVGKYAQNLGASIAGRSKDNGKSRGTERSKVPAHGKPGMLNKSMIAFSTLADGIEQGARNVLTSGSSAASTMIGHRYGSEAGTVASNLTGGIKNVGLVYIDASGVSRKAVLKSVAKGMVVGRMKDGKQVVVGSGDGSQLSPPAPGPSQGPVRRRPSPSPTPPPAYGAPGTFSLGGASMSGAKR
ncbi:senescence-associated protein-domain-containing protein [Aspergillus cavernicola]|uniref:Senescence-associated protein-domain-containing protein n=1 Tax=Aspergillus cavernicola TaxID=176166 RepID=A0ABR4I8U3_9EURO